MIKRVREMGTVLWAFGIGIGAVGIALGARATLVSGAGGASPVPR